MTAAEAGGTVPAVSRGSCRSPGPRPGDSARWWRPARPRRLSRNAHKQHPRCCSLQLPFRVTLCSAVMPRALFLLFLGILPSYCSLDDLRSSLTHLRVLPPSITHCTAGKPHTCSLLGKSPPLSASFCFLALHIPRTSKVLNCSSRISVLEK